MNRLDRTCESNPGLERTEIAKVRDGSEALSSSPTGSSDPVYFTEPNGTAHACTDVAANTCSGNDIVDRRPADCLESLKSLSAALDRIDDRRIYGHIADEDANTAVNDKHVENGAENGPLSTE